MLLLDQHGEGYRVGVGDLPVVRANQRGTHVGGVVGGGPNAPLAGAVLLPADPEGWSVLTVSAAGLVKRSAASEFTESRHRSMQAAKTKAGDHLAAVLLAQDDDDLMLAHSGGLVTRFAVTDVRVMGRTAAGVAGMNVPEGSSVVAASVLPGGADEIEVLTIAEDGAAKRSAAAEYPRKGRGGKGLKAGAEPLRYCGTAVDLHLAADTPQVVRPVDVGEAKRAAAGTALVDGTVTSVIAEQAPRSE